MSDPGLVLLAVAVVLVAVCLRDALREAGTLTAPRRTWLRLSLILAAVAIGLHFLRLLTR